MSKYRNPKINITKVYTRNGDQGTTHLIGGEEVSKDDIRVRGYGDIEELNVLIGISINNMKKHAKISNYSYISDRLSSIQNELFNLGTILASTGKEVTSDLPQIENNDITILEHDIDKMNKELKSLESFTLPGGNQFILNIHHSRVVCRRAERHTTSIARQYPDFNLVALRYLNRLSDYFFVLGRYVSKYLDIKEELWDPNNITSNKK